MNFSSSLKCEISLKFKIPKWCTSQSTKVSGGIKGKRPPEILSSLSFSDISRGRKKRLEVKVKGYGTMLSFAFLLIGKLPAAS